MVQISIQTEQIHTVAISRHGHTWRWRFTAVVAPAVLSAIAREAGDASTPFTFFDAAEVSRVVRATVGEAACFPFCSGAANAN